MSTARPHDPADPRPSEASKGGAEEPERERTAEGEPAPESAGWGPEEGGGGGGTPPIQSVPGAGSGERSASYAPRPLNTPTISASNSKQVRQREAEEDRALIAK